MNVKVEVSLIRTFVATHSLPGIGVTEPHEHAYELRCGYSADVDPEVGCARPLQELANEVDAVVTRVHGTCLNTTLPVPPTAEMLACWVLAELPPRWEWAAIKAYDGFTCKVERKDIGARGF